MFHKGQKVRGGLFSRDTHGAVVADYMRNLNAFSERRWKSLLTASGIIESEKPANSSNTSSLECARHSLYIPSSP
jgi:hypothetical protein